MPSFQLEAPFKPCGDQGQAIDKLVAGIAAGRRHQALLGVTGSGKTFTMANVVAQVQKPTLVLVHNKTLAGQLYQEFKQFFPHNAVEYFVSYYDYYQPEAYIPQSNTYIAKDASVNDAIDQMRHAATTALLQRNDVLIVSSVSCIYGLGSPEVYHEMVVFLEEGMEIRREKILAKLVEIQYARNDMDFHRGTFRARGDVIEIFPASNDAVSVRIELFGDVVDAIHEIDPLTGKSLRKLPKVAVYPNTHYLIAPDRYERAITGIEFRLPSAIDNRPLTFAEFERCITQAVYISATPGSYELGHAAGEVVEQILRPTGLMDPVIEVRPAKGQVDHLLGEVRTEAAQGGRVLITTLTKRMAEDLSEYYHDLGIKVRYLHSDIKTLERAEIIRDLRRGVFDVLVGINLLREGLDLPEVTLVAILDADKEGYLRSYRSLIQTAGRAARNVRGHVILYGDAVTDSMQMALAETGRRRTIQADYNARHGIVPTSIKKDVLSIEYATGDMDAVQLDLAAESPAVYGTEEATEQIIKRLETEMKAAAKELEFERAAALRNRIRALKMRELELKPEV